MTIIPIAQAKAGPCLDVFVACYKQVSPLCEEQIKGHDKNTEKARALCTLGVTSYCYGQAEKATSKEQCDQEASQKQGSGNENNSVNHTSHTPNR